MLNDSRLALQLETCTFFFFASSSEGTFLKANPVLMLTCTQCSVSAPGPALIWLPELVLNQNIRFSAKHTYQASEITLAGVLAQWLELKWVKPQIWMQALVLSTLPPPPLIYIPEPSHI